MIKKVIIPVAGLGTRFLPATKAQPKEMLPIVDKPVIQYLVEEAVHSGISNVIFVTGRNKRPIEDHFDHSFEVETALKKRGKDKILKEMRDIANLARFTYVRQKEPRGDGDALLCASHLIDRDEAVAVLYGDDIIDSKVPCLKSMMKVFEKYNDVVIALEEIPKKDVSRYGVVKAIPLSKNIYQITDIQEKPSPKEAFSNLTVVGKYILTPEVFVELGKLTPGKDEIRLTNALKALLKKKPIYGYKFEGKRYDCGSKIGFLEAVVDMGLKHPEVRKEFRKYLNKIKTR
jgi:UTP--glucose-1-phosphate uridylyltransferase